MRPIAPSPATPWLVGSGTAPPADRLPLPPVAPEIALPAGVVGGVDAVRAVAVAVEAALVCAPRWSRQIV